MFVIFLIIFLVIIGVFGIIYLVHLGKKCIPNCSGKCNGEKDSCGGVCNCKNGQICNLGTCKNPTIVIVGSSGREDHSYNDKALIYVSKDIGKTWQLKLSENTENSFKSVAYSGVQWMAVGDLLMYVSNDDGDTWTTIFTEPSLPEYNAILWVKELGLWVVSSNNSNSHGKSSIYYAKFENDISKYTNNWVATNENMFQQCNNVSYNVDEKCFLAAGISKNIYNPYIIQKSNSIDGNWTIISDTTFEHTKIANAILCKNNSYIALVTSYNENSPSIYYYNDKKWTKTDNTFHKSANAIACNSDRNFYVTVGNTWFSKSTNHSSIAFSYNGTNWQSDVSNINDNFIPSTNHDEITGTYAVAWIGENASSGENSWIVVGKGNKNSVATSIDGKVWNLCSDSNFSTNTFFKGVAVGF